MDSQSILVKTAEYKDSVTGRLATNCKNYPQFQFDKRWTIPLIQRYPKTGKYSLFPGRIEFVEEDGPEGIEEDFSNNLEYYLFNLEKLHSKNPKIYNWIKSRMGDKFQIRKGT